MAKGRRAKGEIDDRTAAAQSAAEGAARAFTPSLATQSAPDADVETYLARQVKFDPDVWIVEIEDRAGRNFLDVVAG